MLDNNQQLVFLDENGNVTVNNLSLLEKSTNNNVNTSLSNQEQEEDLKNREIISENGCDIYLISTENELPQVEENKNHITVNLLVKINKGEFKLSLNIDKLKAFAFPYIKEKINGPESLRLLLCFGTHYKKILTRSFNKTNNFGIYENINELGYSDTFNKHKTKKEIEEENNAKLEKKIKITINSIDYNINLDLSEISFHFNISGYEFKIENIKYTKIKQHTGDYNEETFIINYDKKCLNNIGINMVKNRNKGEDKWVLFKDTYQNYKEARTEISQMIFNQLNSTEVKSIIN